MAEFDPRQYWETRHSRNLGPRSVGYAILGVPYNDWMYKVRQRVFLQTMRKLGEDFSGRRILDIGSGTGFYIKQWERLGARQITGADISATALEFLAQRFPDHDFVDLDIGGTDDLSQLGRQDVVSAFDVLYHITDDEKYKQAIKNISSLIEPGGLFVFTENFLHDREERVLHQVSRSLETITQVLADCSFTVVKRIPVFYLMNRPIDSDSGFLHRLWEWNVKFQSSYKYGSYLSGLALFPIELLCLSLAKEGPSTEMMICRKVP